MSHFSRYTAVLPGDKPLATVTAKDAAEAAGKLHDALRGAKHAYGEWIKTGCAFKDRAGMMYNAI